MAVVERAYDTGLERPVAVKVLGETLLENAELRTRFVREARAAARLSHPNIVRIFDAGESDGRPYIVMEYVEGETLAALLARRGRLWPAEAVELAAQASAGLAHAHENGLVHRDIKPQNLLVRNDGTLKIADFGIARAEDTTRLTQHGTVLGTAAYLSPEQASGKEVTAATDVYALGAVLYEALCGRPPYAFTSLADLAELQRTGAITPLRDVEPAVPDGLEAVVMRALAREPSFRYPSAAALRTALLEAVAPIDAGATLVPFPSRTSTSVAGLALWMWVAAAALVAAVAVVIAGVSRSGGGTRTTTTTRVAVVRSVPHGSSAAAEARNLAAWLRRYSRDATK